MRESSLLVLLHALMTLPCNTFPAHRLLEEMCRSAIDPRRRVRHAALEGLAVLSQYISPKEIMECSFKVSPDGPSRWYYKLLL